MTPKRAGRELFAAHSVPELAIWDDFELEDQGRLTEPTVYHEDPDEPIIWRADFELIGSKLRALDDPNEAAFDTSGRLGNEATFPYQMMIRKMSSR